MYTPNCSWLDGDLFFHGGGSIPGGRSAPRELVRFSTSCRAAAARKSAARRPSTRTGRQNSNTWLFCSRRGWELPDSSSISCMVSSISLGLRCVM